jgi:hypothetical protein
MGRKVLWAGVGIGALVLAVGGALALTWDTFPGGYVKNRLGLSDGERATRKRKAEIDRLRQGLAGSASVVVRKGKRELIVRVQGREIFRARVGLGGAPTGHKEREGDRRTPEGEYYICTRNPRSAFHLFLGLSYPGIPDADRGLAQGMITPEQHREIVRAVREGRAPPWDTPLGGAVGIHGSGASWDWTLGWAASRSMTRTLSGCGICALSEPRCGSNPSPLGGASAGKV